MDDAEYLFYKDTKEKKITAQSARKKVTHTGCKLPSDYMTSKEKTALNGEVQTMNIRKPMTYLQFKMMPKDLQEDYLTFLRDEFDCSGSDIRRVFGLSSSGTLSYYCKRNGIRYPFDKTKKGEHRNRLDKNRWEKFWAGEDWRRQDASESHENAPETTNSLSEGNEPVSQDASESHEKPLCETKMFEAPGALVYSNDLIDLYYDGFGYHPLSRTSGEELDLAQMWSRGTEKQKAAAIDIATRVNTEDWKRPVVGTKDVTDLFNATAAAIEAVTDQKEDRRTLDEIVTDQPFETQTVNVTLRDIRDWNAVVRALSSFPLPLHNTVTISLHAVRGEE